MTLGKSSCMKKTIVRALAFTLLTVLLASCGAPPPLKSDKYLSDTSLLNPDPSCRGPCFHGITLGKTTYTDALRKVKADTAFSNVQSQDSPPAANWSTKAGEACCQLSANDKGLVNALLVKVAPGMTAQDVIDKYGKPQYVNSVDYTDQEVAMALIFPDKGLVTWVSPGDPKSSLDGKSPVVMVLYLDPNDWKSVLDTATLQGWNGFLPYATYKNATPVVTPRITVTPGG